MPPSFAEEEVITADDWLRSANQHISDAIKAHKAGLHPSSIYYLTGLAIECFLKAAIIRRYRLNRWPSDSAQRGWNVHNLRKLLKYAGLNPAMQREMEIASDVAANWMVIKDWTVNKRYPGATPDRRTAGELLRAVTDKRHGVWQWLEQQYPTL